MGARAQPGRMPASSLANPAERPAWAGGPAGGGPAGGRRPFDRLDERKREMEARRREMEDRRKELEDRRREAMAGTGAAEL